MKKIKVFLLSIILITSFGQVGFADHSKDGIEIDGDFSDWKGMPICRDDIGDTEKPHEDIQYVQYIGDQKYLYLHVKRSGADQWTYWNLKVVVPNARKGSDQEHKYFPDKNDRWPQNQTNPDKDGYISFDAPQYDITVYYKDAYPTSGFAVKTSFDGVPIEENIFSVSSDGTEVEFKIPLQRVGLNGMNKEVKFMLKSGVMEGLAKVDWVIEEGITITTGSTLWQLSFLFLFIVVPIIAYKKLKKEKVEDNKNLSA